MDLLKTWCTDPKTCIVLFELVLLAALFAAGWAIALFRLLRQRELAQINLRKLKRRLILVMGRAIIPRSEYAMLREAHRVLRPAGRGDI